MFRTSLPPEAGNAREARRFVADALESLHCTHLQDTASLLTSEVVTNAIVHANTPIEVRVDTPQPGRVRIEVADLHPSRPAPRTAAADDERGRGLALVVTLAAAWGIETSPSGTAGKTIWFELV